jgi:hypothetical protein
LEKLGQISWEPAADLHARSRRAGEAGHGSEAGNTMLCCNTWRFGRSSRATYRQSMSVAMT